MLLSPRNWLLLAIFLAPLRAYGWTGFPLGTLSGFRMALFFTLSLLFLKVLAQKKIKYANGSKIGLALATMNAGMVITSVIFSPKINVGDAATMALVKFTGWCVVVVFCLVFITRLDLRLAFKVYVFSSVIPMAIGWYQWLYYLMYKNFASIPFSELSVHGVKMLGTVYRFFLRPSSTFLEPNFYAYFLVSVGMILLSNLLSRKRFIGVSLSIALLISVTLQLLGTLSLSGLIGCLVGVVVVVALFAKRAWKVCVVGAVIGLIVAILFLEIPELDALYGAFFVKLEGRLGDIEGGFGRAVFFRNAISAIGSSAGLGVGFGGLGHYYVSRISSAHNALLTVLAEQGVIAFFVIVLWMFWVLVGLMMALRNGESQALIVGAIGSVVAVMVGNLAYDAMFSYDSMWCLFGICTLASAILGWGGHRKGLSVLRVEKTGPAGLMVDTR